MIEVIGDFMEYDALGGLAEAEGNVKINSTDFNATANCAVMHPNDNTLDLFDGNRDPAAVAHFGALLLSPPTAAGRRALM